MTRQTQLATTIEGKIPPKVQIVPLFGVIGTDKTIFINNITGSNLPVPSEYGDGICTKKPEMMVSLIDGRTVAFINVPGWEDD